MPYGSSPSTCPESLSLSKSPRPIAVHHLVAMTRFLVAANLAIPLAVLIFASGFFPYKPFMPGLASHADYAEHGEPPVAQFDKLIFMVIDALRSDFVFSSGSGFTFTQK